MMIKKLSVPFRCLRIPSIWLSVRRGLPKALGGGIVSQFLTFDDAKVRRIFDITKFFGNYFSEKCKFFAFSLFFGKILVSLRPKSYIIYIINHKSDYVMTEEEIMLQEELLLQEAEGNTATGAQEATGAPAADPQPQEAAPRHTVTRFREVMQERGWGTLQMSQTLGIAPGNVSNAMKPSYNPTLATLDRWAEALGVPTWQLIASPDEVRAYLMPQPMPAPEPTVTPEPAPAGARPAVLPTGKPAPEATEATETPTGARPADLITVDPQTGETRLYRLINR